MPARRLEARHIILFEIRPRAPTGGGAGGAAATTSRVGSTTAPVAAVARRPPRVVLGTCAGYLLRAAQLNYPHGTRCGWFGGRRAVAGRRAGAVGGASSAAVCARSGVSRDAYIVLAREKSRACMFKHLSRARKDLHF